MGITNVYLSGTQVDGGGNSLPVQPQIPGTFTKNIVFRGVTFSTAAGSYDETSTTEPIWVADAACQVIAVYERHQVAGSTLGMLVHAIGSTPLGSGANVLASTISHISAVNVYNQGSLINSTTISQLAEGDALGWRYSIPGALPPLGSATIVLAYI